MAEIKRLNINNPAANTPTNTFIGTGFYIISVIAANVDANTETLIDVWIAPDDSEDDAEWGYIVKNLQIDPGDSFETFRFAIVADDYLYVQSNNGNASFTTVGINQV